jgi:hypothetical protein
MKKSGFADDRITTRTVSSTDRSPTICAVAANSSNVKRLIGGLSKTTRAIPSALETLTPMTLPPFAPRNGTTTT